MSEPTPSSALEQGNTTFLVLSDTHDTSFPGPSTLPKADVAIHCGDMTMIGGLSNYKTFIANMLAIPAELKLVIAGNHDVSLDPKWWAENLDGGDDPSEPEKALALFEAQKDKNLFLLSEGTHFFKLADRRYFLIYASPYTPAFGGYAFSYGPDEDRFTKPRDTDEGAWMRVFVDIAVTHGPPAVPEGYGQYKLDVNRR
ncbi:hypothetical protein OQA88_2108 [Cercophora sp. LCS_1]